MRIFLKKKATGETVSKKAASLVVEAATLEEAAEIAAARIKSQRSLERARLSVRWQLAAASATDRRLLVGEGLKVSTSYSVGKRDPNINPKLGIGNY